MEKYFFNGWDNLLYVGVCSVVSYLVLLALIRVSGKRTLAKMNAFDMVVTITMGSTLSSMILGSVPLAEGFLALCIIIGLQFLFAWISMKSDKASTIINNEPTLLFYDGKFIEHALKKEMLTEEEILSQIRQYRLGRIEDVQAIVMELNGEFSVIKKTMGKHTSLKDIRDE